jgi:hypothetical protein
MALSARPKTVFFMPSSEVFAVLWTLPTARCSLSPITSLDDFRTLFVEELVATIGAEKLDLLASKFLVVTIKVAFALGAGHPENFCHGSS